MARNGLNRDGLEKCGGKMAGSHGCRGGVWVFGVWDWAACEKKGNSPHLRSNSSKE